MSRSDQSRTRLEAILMILLAYLEEAFKILKMQKNRIKNTAQEILKKEGVKQKVNVHFVQEKFPEKNYGQYNFQKVFTMQ